MGALKGASERDIGGRLRGKGRQKGQMMYKNVNGNTRQTCK